MVRYFPKWYRDDCIGRIYGLNSNIHRIIGALHTPTAQANQLAKDVTRNYQQVRKDAIVLYGALREHLQISRCPCQVCTIHFF